MKKMYYTFALESPLFDSKKKLSNSLRCRTYAMDYSKYYHENITDSKALL